MSKWKIVTYDKSMVDTTYAANAYSLAQEDRLLIWIDNKLFVIMLNSISKFSAEGPFTETVKTEDLCKAHGRM